MHIARITTCGFAATRHILAVEFTSLSHFSNFLVSANCDLVTNYTAEHKTFPSIYFRTETSCDPELWPMTLTYESEVVMIKINQHVKYL